MPTNKPTDNTSKRQTTNIPRHQPQQHEVPQIRAEVYWLNPNPDSSTRAMASMTIAGAYKISGISVKSGKNGLFVAMPSYKTGDKYNDLFHAVSTQAREQMTEAVMASYEQKLAAQEQGEAPIQDEQEAANEQDAEEGQASDPDESQGQTMGG